MERNDRKNSYRLPWTDAKGELLPDDQLQAESQSWSPETWEKYLKSLEVAQNEVLLADLDETQEKRLIDNQLSEEGSDFKLLPRAVKQALLELTFRQRRIIELVFFGDLTHTATANKMGISRVAVSRTVARALRRLSHILQPRLSHRTTPKTRGARIHFSPWRNS